MDEIEVARYWCPAPTHACRGNAAGRGPRPVQVPPRGAVDGWISRPRNEIVQQGGTENKLEGRYCVASYVWEGALSSPSPDDGRRAISDGGMPPGTPARRATSAGGSGQIPAKRKRSVDVVPITNMTHCFEATQLTATPHHILPPPLPWPPLSLSLSKSSEVAAAHYLQHTLHGCQRPWPSWARIHTHGRTREHTGDAAGKRVSSFDHALFILADLVSVCCHL